MSNTKAKKTSRPKPNPKINNVDKQIANQPPPAQGISGRLFGLFKKLPMSMTSPTKEASPAYQSDEYTESGSEEEDPDENSEDDHPGHEEPEGEEEYETEDQMKEEKSDQETLGDEQCRAIMENFILETTTRTNLLRTRTQTHFRPALRRRLDFEISRITPSIAQVTALDYHQRDQGNLRQTMQYIAMMAVEQKGIHIGMKRTQSQEELAWDEKEKIHRKRKRVLTNNGSTSSKTSCKILTTHGQNHPAEEPLVIPSKNKIRQSNRSQSRPPTSRSAVQAFTVQPNPTDLNPRLPSTPLLSDHNKPARPARRNESLISVNGSPVISNSAAADVIDVAALPPVQQIFNGAHHTEFTFVKTSKWKDLEDQLKNIEMNEHERRKLNDMLHGLRMG